MRTVLRECPICGGPMPKPAPTGPGLTACSRQCRLHRLYGRPLLTHCRICATPLPNQRSPYCSDHSPRAAAERRRALKREKTCLGCGDRFVPRRVADKCCSKRCGRKAAPHQTWARARELAEQNGERRPCQHCGKVFAYHPKLRTTYCSIICARAARDGVAANCRQCGAPITEGKVYCSERCGERAAKSRRLHRQRAAGPSDAITLGVLAERDGWKCGLCGHAVRRGLRADDPLAPSIDHILPISHGGLHQWGNVHLAHRSCNTARGNYGPVQLRWDLPPITHERTRDCVTCGKAFVPRGHATACSVECRRKREHDRYTPAPPRVSVCRDCGETFHTVGFGRTPSRCDACRQPTTVAA